MTERTSLFCLSKPPTVRLFRWLFLSLLACLPQACNRSTMPIQPALPTQADFERITVPSQTSRQLDALVDHSAKAPSPPAAETKRTAEPGGAVPIFSFPEAITFALQNNPRLKIATEAIEKARGQSEIAFAPFLPEIDLFSRVGGTSASLSPGAPGPVGGILAIGDGPRGFAQAEVDLQWTLWDFGRREGRYNQALSKERIAGLQLVRARQTVAFDVTSAYLGVLQAWAGREVQEQAIRRTRAALDDAVARRKAGVADRDDVLRAELLVADARDAAVVASEVEYDAVARLNYALGRNPGLPLRVVRWNSRPEFKKSLEECLQTAASQRQEVAIAAQAIAGTRSGLEAANADFLPMIYLRLGVGRIDGEGVLTGFHEGGSLHLDQKIFSGGRRAGERDAAQAGVRAASASAEAMLDTIALEVNLAFRGVSATLDRIRLAETAIVQADEYLRLITVRYKNGNATPTDVVDAETSATRAALRMQTAVYDHLAALARLDYALGTTRECLTEPVDAASATVQLPSQQRPADSTHPGGKPLQ
jgi:outer membrane protein